MGQVSAPRRPTSLRLFNGEGDASERTVSLGVRPLPVDLVELDGRVVRQLEVRAGSSGTYDVRLSCRGLASVHCDVNWRKGS